MEQITFEQLPKAVIQLYNKLDRIESLLAEALPLIHPESDKFLTVHEAANFLDLAAPTIYSLVSKGEIPVNKRGKRLYFSKMELEEWVKAGRKKTNSEIAEEAENYFLNKKKGGRK